MNRRSLLKTILGAGAALIGGRAIAEEDFDPDGLYTQKPALALSAERFERKLREMEDKYWEAQAKIDALEEELRAQTYVRYTVEGVDDGDRVYGFAQPKPEGASVPYEA